MKSHWLVSYKVSTFNFEKVIILISTLHCRVLQMYETIPWSNKAARNVENFHCYNFKIFVSKCLRYKIFWRTFFAKSNIDRFFLPHLTIQFDKKKQNVHVIWKSSIFLFQSQAKFLKRVNFWISLKMKDKYFWQNSRSLYKTLWPILN